MAENDTPQSDRTEDPTPKRLQDARRKGQIARSRELSMTLVMLAGAASFLFMGPYYHARLESLFALGLDFDRRQAFDPAEPLNLFGEAVLAGLTMLLPLFVILVFAAFVAALSFGGWAFSSEGLKPKLERLNPLNGLKRVFGLNGLAELLKALAKFLLVAVVAAVILWTKASDLIRLGQLDANSGLAQTAELLSLAFIGVCATLILIAAIDVPFQWFQHRRKLRMTKQEVKEELKETEGRPEVRSRIRQAQQELANRRMMEAVPTADVVATNPTHFAVALRYDDKKNRAPIVVAKGTDLLAARIREIATENGVPIIEAPPLARALYRTVELGREVPAALYVTVAQVLTYVYQLKACIDRGVKPPPAPAFEV
jgi:flagellar biosynthetic protein FlhB